MDERHQDFELLYRFTREGQQSAFADVVWRHFDLVFATALRKLADPGAAQEVAQNVFTALARKAWRFAPDDSLPAWLHKAALLESKSWLRGELGRRRREAAAAEMGTTMKNPEAQTAFHALLPLLDDALLSLREKDRTALLLRFYERQSLREVGMAFGVSEDTAQKRVQSALEKVADFFKRRGFETATVAGAVGALQHTAASASTAMVNTVAGAALQAAPPALVGVGAWLAWLASLSRVQTTAVCVVLATASVGWQAKEKQAAGEEAQRRQRELLAVQNQHATLQAEIDRLRLEADILEPALILANAAAARAAEAAQAFEAWKRNTRGQLLVADYRWDDNSLFVRIPKEVLPELSARCGRDPFSPDGEVSPYARELLGLTSSERRAVEQALQQHLAETEQFAASRIQEESPPLRKGELAGRRYIIRIEEEETLQFMDQILEQRLADLRRMLGEERWPIVQARVGDVQDGKVVFPGGKTMSLNQRTILRGHTLETLDVRVGTNAVGALLASWTVGGGVAGLGREPLSTFLPGGDPNQTNSVARQVHLSKGLRQRALVWLQDQATEHLSGKEGR